MVMENLGITSLFFFLYCPYHVIVRHYCCDIFLITDLETEIEVLRNTKQRLTLEGEQYQEQLKYADF